MAKESGTEGVVSPELDAMVGDVLGAFLDELAAGSDPGVVLCLEDANANRYEAAFTEDGVEACLAGARKFLQANRGGLPGEHVGPVERYAIAYVGCVELEGSYQDAILVSFYEQGLGTGFSAYVQFEGMGTGDGFMWSDPAPAGEEDPLI